MGYVRFGYLHPTYEADLAVVRESLDPDALEKARAEGAALPIADALAYAQRGRGERKRPSTGWASLTPTELEVVKLVAEGITNAQIAQRLFVSTGTVQTHLKHVFAKLGVATRTELAVEASRRSR